MGLWWLAPGVVAVAALAAALVYRPVRATILERRYRRARKEFHQQRERLEAKFFSLASASGKPRGLRWTDCEFEDDVAYARDRRSGNLSAFVGVTISFAAVAGGGMEDVEALGNLRAASAVFHFRDGRWQTDGRAMFNLNPTEAIAYHRQDFELIGHEAPQRT